MAAKNATLYLTPGYIGSTVDLDGRKVTGIRALTLSAAVGEVPTMTLDLILREVLVHGELVITIPDSTRDTLIALGWSPPSDGPERV